MQGDSPKTCTLTSRLKKHSYTAHSHTKLNSKDSSILLLLLLHAPQVYFWCSDTQPEDVCKKLLVSPEKIWKEENARAGKKNRCGISEATVNTIHRLWPWKVLQLKTPQPLNLLRQDWKKLKLLCNEHTRTHTYTNMQAGRQCTHTYTRTLIKRTWFLCFKTFIL